VRKARNAPEPTQDENRALDTPKNPHTTYVGNVEREQVRAAIRQLPVDSREIIILRTYEELSYQEIAAILGCPVGTVMSRLSRARQRLRVLLQCAVVHRHEKPCGAPRRTIHLKSVTVGHSSQLSSPQDPELPRSLNGDSAEWNGLR
jgi:predicted DNA-binding protein (UPF0251 family)